MAKKKPERPIEEIEAGDAFVKSLVPRADASNPYPLWHGWAIMDAFLAGIDYARRDEQTATDCGKSSEK